jgi:hypothetical protein
VSVVLEFLRQYVGRSPVLEPPTHSVEVDEKEEEETVEIAVASRKYIETNRLEG